MVLVAVAYYIPSSCFDVDRLSSVCLIVGATHANTNWYFFFNNSYMVLRDLIAVFGVGIPEITGKIRDTVRVPVHYYCIHYVV